MARAITWLDVPAGGFSIGRVGGILQFDIQRYASKYFLNQWGLDGKCTHCGAFCDLLEAQIMAEELAYGVAPRCEDWMHCGA